MKYLITLVAFILSLNFATVHTQYNKWFDAITNGNLEDVEFLIESGEDINTVKDDGETALFLASNQRFTELAELLIASGADFNAVRNDGLNSLMITSLG